MFNRHVTHLLTRYVNGTLRPRQMARVVNHVRTCAECRAALAREERVNGELRLGLPQTGAPRAGQLAGVWADVLREVNAPRRRRRLDGPALLSSLSVLVVVALFVVLAVPLMDDTTIRVEAAPHQARPINTTSPTPGVTETDEAVNAPLARAAGPQPQATIAFAGDDGVSASEAGMTPAPVPQVTVSPEAVQGGARW